MLDKLFTFAKKLSKPSTFQVKYRLNANGVEMVYVYACIYINGKCRTYEKQMSLKTMEQKQEEVINEITKNTFEN